MQADRLPHSPNKKNSLHHRLGVGQGRDGSPRENYSTGPYNRSGHYCLAELTVPWGRMEAIGPMGLMGPMRADGGRVDGGQSTRTLIAMIILANGVLYKTLPLSF